MQLGLAADLMGVTKNDNPNYLEEVFNIISSNAEIAMDLIGKHLNNEQKRRGRRLTPREATVFYNAGNNALDSYINGEITQERIINSIYGRSWEWQNAIRMALEGLIVGQPDNCVLDSCNTYMEQDLSEWTNNLSMTVQY
ncbi:hypothetical protein [Psychrobacter phenylpyruvicus]|uniref:Uncharacterized protein n=1 Tax=Psychrobacter phenylpyruvicus TaxID=29432 RepID=A0A379LGU0_9GAMM|nr:hypothetical protein [Psychrobacter phenylpyruvicus]SUD89800.1 Uncharacterised protein [Psychrobacter phenylpyruvicus]